MPVGRDIDGPNIAHAEPGVAQSGFTEGAFNARYDRGRSAGPDSGDITASGPTAKPAGPRSRNSYMRARARRLAASAAS